MVACLAALILAACPVLADGGADTGEEEVPLFTNEDLLERYGPPDSEVRPAAPATDEAAWSFVNDYLARAYARIDADREYEMNRLLNEAKARKLDRANSRPRYIAPYAGLYGFWARPYRYPGGPEVPEGPEDPGDGGGQTVGGADGRGGHASGGWHASPPTIRVGGAPRGFAPRHVSGGGGGKP
jgi:hypothetical protein